jgi:predicted nucleotidyltransferase component of viral defense system
VNADPAFLKAHYGGQIDALQAFLDDACSNLPERNTAYVRFGGGTALAIYYFQHRLSFDIDLFATDPQIMNYLSPKHWMEETALFNRDSYIDFAHHIRVLFRKNNIKVDVLVAQDFVSEPFIDDSRRLFSTDVHVESIEDIIAKKIIYRRHDNLTRDIIDIAVADRQEGTLRKLSEAEAVSRQDVSELRDALASLDRETYETELAIVKPFETYMELAKRAPDILIEACDEIIGDMKKK